MQGRRDSDAGKYTGAEVRASNYGVSDVAYSTSAFPGGVGVWLNADGNADSAAGHTIGNPFGRQFEVGIAFNGQVAGGKTGGVRVSCIRDDSTATNFAIINGAHTIAFAVAAGAGYGVIGALARQSASALFEIVGADAFTDPLVQFGSSAFSRGYSVRLRNSASQSIWFIAGSASEFLTNTAIGDHGIKVQTASKMFHVGGSVKVLTVTQDDKFGAFAAAPVAKPTVTGAKGSNAALGSLMTALANLGWVVDSTTA
jgi:hypothetical protein